ncbi:MAG: hypothetical protein O7E52_01415, partial [Candidatus Poribacteria bacterium]|nr:hypothetical protein [Candidatus Poribacteria bacterium]
ETHEFWRAFALAISVMLVVFMVACGDDDDDDSEPSGEPGEPSGGEPGEPQPPSATSVQADVAAGTEVPPNQSFNLTFDEAVDAASIGGTPATGGGKNWSGTTGLTPGAQNVTLVVTWTNKDGSSGNGNIGPFSVAAEADVMAPVIVTGTLANAAQNVDPAPINAGGFRFDFDEQVTGTIELQDAAGANLNWTANVGGTTATLTVVAGQELANETEYKIVISVTDGSNNAFSETITFTTKPKE